MGPTHSIGLHNLSVALESANKMNYNDTVVLTSTFYDNSPEGIARSQAARVFLENSSLTGIRIVMCDGGSGTDFLDFVRSFPNVTLLEYHDNPVLQKSHAPRRKHGMQYILEHFPDIHFILWTEPEKADILLPQNLSKVINPLRENKADQTIPTPKPNDNRPEYMRAIEIRAMRRAMDIVQSGGFQSRNKAYSISNKEYDKDDTSETMCRIKNTADQRKAIYGEPDNLENFIDHWFGPRAFTKKIALDYFMKSDREIWDWIILPSAKAQSKEGTTIGVSIDFSYADSQLNDEINPDRIPALKRKRIEQYRTLIRAFREEFMKIL